MTGCALVLASALVEADTITVPDEQPTIQAAIDAARHGDVVRVRAGTYAEHLDLSGKSITLESEAGAGRTIIDGGWASGSTVTCARGEDVHTIIRGFTITGGTGDSARFGEDATVGGGLLLIGVSPVIEECRISGNTSGYEGGGVWSVGGGAPRFVRCSFQSNRSERGGAVYLHRSPAAFIDCRFGQNDGLFGGGGVFADASSDAVFTGCRFEECYAGYNGGAVNTHDSHVRLDRCTFVRNGAGLSGGAVYRGFRATATMTEPVYRTLADDVGGGASGQLVAPKGACCIGSRCIEVEHRACADAGGRWSGEGTDCVSVLAAVCPVALPGDLNDDAEVDIRDVGILMSLWGE